MQFYSNPERERDTYALPDCEVFYIPTEDAVSYFGTGMDDGAAQYSDKELESMAGWYYWYCFPGCLPDSDPVGPFDTEREAIESAQSEAA